MKNYPIHFTFDPSPACFVHINEIFERGQKNVYLIFQFITKTQRSLHDYVSPINTY